MVTTKKVIIPLYGVKLTIFIFDKWDEIKETLPPDERGRESKGITWTRSNNDFSAIGTAINSRHRLSSVHEAEHIKNIVWLHIGYTPNPDNDEVDAYLIRYIYEKIMDTLHEHDSLK